MCESILPIRKSAAFVPAGTAPPLAERLVSACPSLQSGHLSLHRDSGDRGTERGRGGYPHSGKDKGAERRMDSLSYPQDAAVLDPARSVGVQESEKKELDHFNVRDTRDHVQH